MICSSHKQIAYDMTRVNAKLWIAHVHLTLNDDNQIKELKLIASSLLNPPCHSPEDDGNTKP